MKRNLKHTGIVGLYALPVFVCGYLSPDYLGVTPSLVSLLIASLALAASVVRDDVEETTQEPYIVLNGGK